jgi:hypothetical protein
LSDWRGISAYLAVDPVARAALQSRAFGGSKSFLIGGSGNRLVINANLSSPMEPRLWCLGRPVWSSNNMNPDADVQMIETLYSLAATPPKPSERRDGERHMTLYRVGSLFIDNRRELCLIKNISCGGMMVRAYSDFAEGTPVHVELKSGEPIAGRISWFDEPNAGIEFDSPVDVVGLLTATAEGARPRMPRIEVRAPVTIRDGATVHRMRICDISQGGLKVQSEDSIAPDTDVVVSLPGLDPQAAVIRWNGAGYMGLTFNRLLTLSLLVDWIQQQRGDESAAS